MRLFILTISGAVLLSCGNRHKGEQKPTLLSNLIRITDNEDKGVKEILEYYDGYCKYAIGHEVSSNKGKKKYFELEMSKSNAMERHARTAEMPASNMAYLFYRNLKEEKNNYDEIHTVIILKDGTKMTFKYPREVLAIVDKKMKVVEKIVALLKSKDFEGIKPFLKPDTALFGPNKDRFVARLAEVDPQFGSIKTFLPFGFRSYRMKDGQEVLHISCILLRDKQNSEFSIEVDPASEGDEIILLQYKL